LIRFQSVDDGRLTADGFPNDFIYYKISFYQNKNEPTNV